MSSDYTIDMFYSDFDEIRPLMELTKDVKIPRDEWPVINIDDTIYGVNPNLPEARIMRYLQSKYGKVEGGGYGFRILATLFFIRENHNRLMQEGLVRYDEDVYTEVCPELIQVLLESSLSKDLHEFDSKNLKKIVKATRRALRD